MLAVHRVRATPSAIGKHSAVLLGFVAALTVASASTAANAAASANAGVLSVDALKALSVEELMDIEVTSVSRRPEKFLQAPAAIQVVTGEDIRRSGASSIASALRQVNSLDVAQENSHEWVISARGFSSDVGNKLLVLMDGRTVYTPLFSGVFWDRQDYMLEDIERIEVISGPGGALWGANAVNGVINIATKSAEETQGLYVEAGGGTSLQGFGAMRYGGAFTPDVSYRVYGKYFDRDNEALPNGRDARDSWHAGQGGFRIDAQASSDDRLTLQGDMYRNEELIQSGGEGKVSGSNLLGRWSRAISTTSDMSLQVYYDRTHLILPVPGIAFAPAGTFEDELDTYDLDFQHGFQWGERQHLVWGFGFRYTHDVVGNSPALAFLPAELDQRLYSGFVQDEIVLREDVSLTLGAKVEHTDYTGFEVEPSIRLQWSLSDQQTLWGAVSRAVRTPSRIDRDISQPAPQYFIVILQGGANFDSEKLLAYELGWRAQVGPRAGVSLAIFYNDYDDLRSTTISPPDPLFRLPFPFFFENNLAGETYGFELNATVQALDRWRLYAGYRLLQEDIRVKPGRMDFNNALNETSDPEQQVSLRSSLDVLRGVQLDAGLRWVDTRRVNNAGVPALVPDYVELDVRLGWSPTRALELSVVGQNLLHGRHPEYGKPGPTRVEIERNVYGKVVWRF
jgi:iron complex outermembrane recepter protein